MASLGFIKDLSPIMAVELARRAIPQRRASHLSGNGRRLPRRRRGRLQGGIIDDTATRSRSAAAAAAAHLRHQEEKGGPRRPPWRRLEGGLRRFRHRHDGAVHRALADERRRKSQRGDQRVLQQSDGTRHADRHGGRGRGQCDRTAERGHGQTARKDGAGAQDHAEFQRHERPRGDDHHGGWPAHRTAGDRGRNVLRIGTAAAHRHRARSC